jgi:hypothetical protein
VPTRHLVILWKSEVKLYLIKSEDVQAFLLRHKCNEMLKNITFFETVATENCVRELLIGIIKLYEHNYEPSDDETAHKEIYDVLPVPRPKHLSTNGVHDVAISCNEEVFLSILSLTLIRSIYVLMFSCTEMYIRFFCGINHFLK